MTSFKSLAHKQKMAQLVKDGKMTQEAYNKMYLASIKNITKLPERAKPKKDLK